MFQATSQEADQLDSLQQVGVEYLPELLMEIETHDMAVAHVPTPIGSADHGGELI